MPSKRKQRLPLRLLSVKICRRINLIKRSRLYLNMRSAFGKSVVLSSNANNVFFGKKPY